MQIQTANTEYPIPNSASIEALNGVSDGIWTHDRRGHNPVLYQLSYTHHNRILDFRIQIADY